jgi:hypothetical protein
MTVRTGLFRYVRHQDIERYHKLGWMVVADLGAPHCHYSVLAWRCSNYGKCHED